MPRKAVLTEAEVWIVRNQAFPKTVREWAEHLGVSLPTLMNAKHGRKPYDYTFTEDFHAQMVQKYSNG